MKKILLLSVAFISISCSVLAQTAKIIFSKEQKPNASNSKESFASNDFIYGSMDLGGKTAKEFFKLPEKGDKPYYYLFYVTEVYKGDEFIGDNNWNIVLLKDADLKNTVLNIDVLPDPNKATSVLSGTPMFDAGLASAPLYMLVERQYFKESTTYNIRIRVYYRSLDVYGNEQPWEKWPTCSGSFSFVFNENDVPVLLKNGAAAAGVVAKAIR